jgi:hypothetical protein
MHQVGVKVNFPENFSFLAFKGEAVGVAQNSPYGGGVLVYFLPPTIKYFFCVELKTSIIYYFKERLPYLK